MESLYDYTISFTYGGGGDSRGSIHVNLYQFLFDRGRTITRVRKLFRIMDRVCCMEPSKEVITGQIREFIGQFIDMYPEKRKYDSVYILSLEDKIRYAERQLEKAEYERDRAKYTRDSIRSAKDGVKHFSRKGKVNPKWEELNQRLKQLNAELKQFNETVKKRKAELVELRYNLKCKTGTFTCLEKDRIFLEQVLELLG